MDASFRLSPSQMLSTEIQMTENEGILLIDPSMGPSFQVAGAFQRLGRRLLSLFPNEAKAKRIDKIPMQTFVSDIGLAAGLLQSQAFSTVILGNSENLALNIPVTHVALEAELKLLSELRKSKAELHAILLLPLSTSNEVLRRLENPLNTIFLVPPVFAFRDHGLFDLSLELFKKNPALLKVDKKQMTRSLGEVLYSGDLAGYLVSCPQNKKLMGRSFRIPGLVTTLPMWIDEFREAFGARPTFGQKIAASMTHTEWPEVGPLNAHRELLLSPTEEFFPTVNTSLSRALRSSAEIFRRSPAHDLLFQPGRAL